MSGDDRRRYCAVCEQPVTNLSELSNNELTDLFSSRSNGHRPCVRYYQRDDGTLLTRSMIQQRALWLIEQLAARAQATEAESAVRPAE